MASAPLPFKICNKETVFGHYLGRFPSQYPMGVTWAGYALIHIYLANARAFGRCCPWQYLARPRTHGLFSYLNRR
eukprot:6701699-Pyramimonas_sp.AAC.1